MEAAKKRLETWDFKTMHREANEVKAAIMRQVLSSCSIPKG